MKKTTSNLILLNILFVVCLVISNVVTAKTWATGISIGGIPLTMPGAAICYAITFLMTDVIGELWGRKEANRTVLFGFAGQCLATILIVLTQYLPASSDFMQTCYEALLGTNWVFFIGSMVAYFVSQTWDVFIFHKIRNKWLEKHEDTKRGKWIWNNVSTMTSQIFDTVIFITISFGLGKYLGVEYALGFTPALGVMMLGQYVFKFIIAAFDTPFFYLLTRKSKREITDSDN